MSGYRSRWGSRSIELPTPPPMAPPGHVRGRMLSSNPTENFQSSPMISRVQHRRSPDANVKINHAEEYQRLSNLYLNELTKNRKAFERNRQFHVNEEKAAPPSPRPAASIDAMTGEQSKEASSPEDRFNAYEAKVAETMAKYAVENDSKVEERPVVQQERQPTSSLTGPVVVPPLPNRFSYLLKNSTPAFTPYKHRAGYKSTFETTGIKHQVHERSLPPPMQQPNNGFLDGVYSHQKLPKARGPRTFSGAYGSFGVDHQVHERSETPVRRTNRQRVRQDLEQEQQLSPRATASMGLSLLDQLPSAPKVDTDESLAKRGIRVYPDVLAQKSFEAQAYLSPRRASSLRERPLKVQFGAKGNKVTSAVARADIPQTSKVSRFVINQDPDVKETKKKGFEKHQLLDCLDDLIFSPRHQEAAPLPKYHPAMQLNTSRKKYYPDRAHVERTAGIDYSSDRASLHVMAEPLAMDVGDDGPTDGTSGSGRRAIYLSCPKSLGRKRPIQQKQELFLSKDWTVPEYPDPGDQLMNRKKYGTKGSGSLSGRARDFITGGKDIILPEPGAPPMHAFDQGASPGVKSSYAKQTREYMRAERKWDFMIGHSRHKLNDELAIKI